MESDESPDQFNAHVDLYKKLAVTPSWLWFWVGLAVWPGFYILGGLVMGVPGGKSISSQILGWSLLTYPVAHFAAIVRSRSAAYSGESLRVVKNWANLKWANVICFIVVYFLITLYCLGKYRC